MDSPTFYVYVFTDPRKPGRFTYPNVDYIFTHEPFYVGKGTGGRMRKHLTRYERDWNYNPVKFGKLGHIEEAGFCPLDYAIVFRHSLFEQEAFVCEIDLIAHIGRLDLATGPLANLTAGGEGSAGIVSRHKGKTYDEIYGAEKAEDMRRVRRERFKGKGNPMFGKPSHRRGKPVSEACRRALSLANSRPIKQLDMGGRFVRAWQSAVEAAAELGISPSGIHNCVNPGYRTRSAGGYRWEYVDEPNLKYATEHIRPGQRYYRVRHPDGTAGYTTNLCVYAKQVGQTSSELYKTANGRIKQTNGYAAVRVTREEYLAHQS